MLDIFESQAVQEREKDYWILFYFSIGFILSAPQVVIIGPELQTS
jgi:hypothetical protein